MGLITEFIEVTIGNNVQYYENLGYEIPKYKRANGKMTVRRGTKINVKITDLNETSKIKVKVECDSCGNKYNVTYYTYCRCINNHKGIYYCKKCSDIILNSGENSVWYGKKHTEEIKNKISQSKKGKYSKEKHPRWNPNLTNEERENGRNYLENTEWIKTVLARDGFTCQCCGQHQGNLEAHHLEGWNWCIEKRYDEINGITLCETCHKNFHMKYGKGNNTKEQFEEWVGHAIEVLKFEGKLPTTRKIYCIEEDKVYDSAEILAKEWDIYKQNVYKVCNRKIDENGYYQKSISGKHLLWLDEYEKMSKEDIKKYLEYCKPSKNRAKGISTKKSKYRYLYDENFKLLIEGISNEIAKWLVDNNYIKTISTAHGIIKKNLDNNYPYYSKNKKEQGLYFRTIKI